MILNSKWILELYFFFNYLTRGGVTIEFSEMRGPNKIFGSFILQNEPNILFGPLISENSIVKPPLEMRSVVTSQSKLFNIMTYFHKIVTLVKLKY